MHLITKRTGNYKFIDSAVAEPEQSGQSFAINEDSEKKLTRDRDRRVMWYTSRHVCIVTCITCMSRKVISTGYLFVQ